MSREALSQNSLEVWYTSCADIDEETFHRAETQILVREERERMYRYRQPSDRRLYLAARLLLRSMLEAFTGVAAKDWRFRFNEHGKPETEEGFPPVHFNISHSKDLAICVMHPGQEVGVDVEPIDRQIDSGTASSVLIEREWESYSESPEEQRSEVFIKYWVLKEAYIKATGRGLFMPLTDFFFEFDNAGNPQLNSRLTEGEEAEDWSFFEFQPAGGYAAAAAIRNHSSQVVDLNVRRFRP